MEVEFDSMIRTANKRLTGFLKIPDKFASKIKVHNNVEVVINDQKFFGQIVKFSGAIGVYVPKEIAKNYIGKVVKIKLGETKKSYAKVGSDGRIYLPLDLVRNMRLENNDIICIVISDSQTIVRRYSEVKMRKRVNKIEYKCIIGSDLAGKRVCFNVEKLTKTVKLSSNFVDISEFLANTNFAQLPDGNLIIFKCKIPIIINPKINLHDIALYMGAYYSDGTKKGNNWAICASTFNQANYYYKMHEKITRHSDIEFVISYTNVAEENESNIINRLKCEWAKNFGNYPYKFRIRTPSGKAFGKVNKFGTLIMREHRIALLDFYNMILGKLSDAVKKGDKKLAVDFLCGVLEGDGCVPSKTHGHVIIATNNQEYHAIEVAFGIAGIKSKTVWESPTRVFIRIGSLEILRNFDVLKNKIFALYPKRRRRLFESLHKVGAVQFLLDQNHRSPVWIKTWLKENEFIDKDYKLTMKGKKLRNDLRRCIKSVTVK